MKSSADLEQLSDEELMKIAGLSPQQTPTPSSTAPTAPANLEQMSDEELMQIAGIQPDKAAPMTPQTSQFESGARGALQGGSFGFGDEISAGIGAGVAKLAGALGLGPEELANRSFGDVYNEALQMERGKLKAAEQSNPKTFLAGDVIGSVATPAGALKKGATVANMASVGAGSGILQGYGRSEKELLSPGRALDSAIGGITGAIAGPLVGKTVEAVAKPITKVAGAVIDKIKSAPITKEIKDTLANESADVVSAYQSSIKNGLSPKQALQQAQAQKLGVPLTTGDVTQNVAQQTTEELARTGVYGQDAAAKVNAFREQQGEAIRGAANKVANEIGGADIGMNEADIATNVVNSLKQRAASDKAKATAAYDAVKNSNAFAPLDVAVKLPRAMKQALMDEQFDVEAMPAVNRLLSQTEAAFTQLSKTPENVGVSLTSLENIRKRITNAPASTDAEKAALNIMKKTYDKFSDDIVDQGLISGDDKVLDGLKNARGLWREYKQKYYGDDGKAMLGKIVDNDYTPETTMRMLIGAGKLGANKESATYINQLKNIVGEDSPEFKQLKLAGFTRIFGDDLNGILQGNLKRTKDGAKFAKNFDDLLQNNKSLAEALYSPDELQTIRSLGQTVSLATTRQPGAISTSGTSPVLLNAARSLMNWMPGGQYVNAAIGMVGREASNARMGGQIDKALAGKLTNEIKQQATNTNFARTLGANVGGAQSAASTTEGVRMLTQPQTLVAENQPAQQQPTPQRENIFQYAAEQGGVDPRYLAKVARVESGFNPSAKSSSSSASGLYQFTKGTWRAMVDKYGDETGVTEDMINDPRANAIIAAKLTSENQKALQKSLGRDPSHGELYAAHFLGLDGARRLIQYADNDKYQDTAAARLFPTAAKANRQIFFDGRRAKTVGELYDTLTSKVEK